MVHAVIEQIQPGEVLVLSMPEPAPVALVGELLATQVKVRGAAAILVDAAVRDVEELVQLGLPIWARFVRVKGATKAKVGEVNVTRVRWRDADFPRRHRDSGCGRGGVREAGESGRCLKGC